jgi:hypothetical protein
MYRFIKKALSFAVTFLLNALLLLAVAASTILCAYIVYATQLSQEASDDKVREIYKQLVAASGQSQDALPLYIDDSMIDNAYNDGTRIVIYRWLINHAGSWDEVALVLGHEIAHGMLGHLNEHMPIPEQIPHDGMGDSDYIAVLEANADKLGALYTLKIGYSVCEGRNLFKYWKQENGNALGQDHPDYSYRYDELNINCE